MAQHASEQRSLFGEILDWMLAPLLLLWPMSVAITWLVAQSIANHPYDRELAQMARTLARHVTLEAGAPKPKLDALAAELLRSDDVDQIWYQVLGLRGELVGGDRDLPTPPEDERVAAGEVHFRDDMLNGEPVRVASLWLAHAPLARDQTPPLVQVAETLDKRSRLATEIIKGVILPQFVILPLAVLLVWLALARGIAPLNELQRRIRSRESHDLSPIGEREAPEEVAPLVRAINDLLARLDQSISRQKHFLADAAHQLKTPLAGLRTQAELAQREIDAGRGSPEELKRSLQHIARSSQRAAHMVNQLLAMARAEDQEHSAQLQQEVNLVGLATETVRDFVPRALERRIDLGYEGPAAGDSTVRLRGEPLLVRELIRNLVDNALQYTPAGGTVTVRVVEDPFGQVVVLQVEDNGPGIAPEEREQVFRPFYRVLGSNVDGSGLGLAIVREIAQRYGAEVSIEDALPRGSDVRGPGARFTVRFPAVVAQAASAPRG
ncbi:MAG TPA: sensor histidine kinase N-terminal domain-containing protein [Burkholderiaceae bacterium]|nr:sensor histidine kinase N-terminal domain-containing protein [Burkholderiaceae bacterium]